MLHATNITMAGADELIDGSRDMLDRSGSPAYCAIARCENGTLVPGACTFGSERAARDQGQGLRTMLPGARIYVIERLLRGGRVRWTIWHGDQDERLHQAFEEAPDSWV